MAAVLSNSASFDAHLSRVFSEREPLTFLAPTSVLDDACASEHKCLILHATSISKSALQRLLRSLRDGAPFRVGVASDVPTVEELLQVTEFPVSAYFNSYMADVHYFQMVDAMAAGQSWFHPALTREAFRLARGPSVELAGRGEDAWRSLLTPREREIALDVASGRSNAAIAADRNISERTVKSHLTRIYKKLGVAGRYALAVAIGDAARRAR